MASQEAFKAGSAWVFLVGGPVYAERIRVYVKLEGFPQQLDSSSSCDRSTHFYFDFRTSTDEMIVSFKKYNSQLTCFQFFIKLINSH